MWYLRPRKPLESLTKGKCVCVGGGVCVWGGGFDMKDEKVMHQMVGLVMGGWVC